jgi:ABC-type glycerol-3-phosphate transport system permease component
MNFSNINIKKIIKMKSGMIIMAGMVVLIFVLPSIWMYVKSLKNEKRFKNKLFNLATRSSCEISQFDFWKSTAIGIDKNRHRIFYVRDLKSEELKKEVDLSEIQKCRVLNSSRSLHAKNGNYTAIDKLELIFINKDKNKPEIGLEFYSIAHDSLAIAGEVQLVEKWSGIVEKELAGSV